MKCPTYILPTHTRIVVHEHLESTKGMLVAQRFIKARRALAHGSIVHPVGGHGGDVYLVRIGNGELAVYCYTEFELE